MTDLLDRVVRRLRSRAAAADDARVTVGPRVVLVELRHPAFGRLAGVAHRPPGPTPATWPTAGDELAALAVDAGDDAVEGTAAERAAKDEGSGGESEADAPPARLRRAVGVAALNALSAPDVDWRSGDPMAALSPDVDVVATVGLFRPAFRKFADVEVRVVERDPPDAIDAPPGVPTSTFAPGECARAFDGADVCFVTGSTLVYGGIDRYLAAAEAADVPLVVLIGSTASFLPGPAFDAGVDVLAGASVTDPERVRERALAGDCDTDLHDVGLEKGYVAARDDVPGLTLPSNTNDDQ